jgi:hypothetical protein
MTVNRFLEQWCPTILLVCQQRINCHRILQQVRLYFHHFCQKVRKNCVTMNTNLQLYVATFKFPVATCGEWQLGSTMLF